jgi:hypothetical protein
MPTTTHPTPSFSVLYRLPLLLVLALLLTTTGCVGAPKAGLDTTIAQSFQATNLSMLSQAKWQDIFSKLHGAIGPDSTVAMEAYRKDVFGVEIRVHGATLSVETEGRGTGGGDNSAIWDDLVQVAQRWERSADKQQTDRNAWVDQILQVLLREKTPSPAGPEPAAGESEPAASPPAGKPTSGDLPCPETQPAPTAGAEAGRP